MALKLFPYQGIGETASDGTEIRVGDTLRITLKREHGFGETYYYLYSVRADGAYREYEGRDSNGKPIEIGVRFDGSIYKENDSYRKKVLPSMYERTFNPHGEANPMYLTLGVREVIITGNKYMNN